MKSYRGLTFAILLQEGEGVPKRIQLLKTGTYHDDRYGKVEITNKILSEFVQNFDAKVRRIDIAVDYSHETEEKAAGWFKALELSEDGQELWAVIDWNKAGEKALSEKEFRYISADFNFNYKDNESQKIFGPVLMGAGLTNRPVVKGMVPAVQLHEINNNNKGSKVELKDAMDRIEELKGLNVKLSQGKVKLQEFEMTPEEMMAKIKELEGRLAEVLADKNKLTEDKALAEKTGAFEKMLTEGKAVPAQKDAYLKGDMDAFIKLSEKANLDPKGNEAGKGLVNEDADPQDEVMKLAEAMVKDKKADNVADAIGMVLSENPKLNAAYEKIQFGGRPN